MFKILITFFVTISFFAQAQTKPFYINGIMVNGCDNESYNEFVQIKNIDNSLNTADLKIGYKNIYQYELVQNTSTASLVSGLNNALSSIATGVFLEPQNRIIPANSTILFFPNIAPNFSDFGYPIPAIKNNTYLIFADKNEQAQFPNIQMNLRYVSIYDGLFGDTANFISTTFVSSLNGNYVQYDSTGRPSYINNGCKLYLEEVDNDDVPTGVSNTEKSKIEIYPNPTNGNVAIKGIHVSTIEISNSLGQLVATTFSNTINLSGLSKGIYILKITSRSGEVSFRKVILE